MPDWTDSGWRAGADAWIEAQVASLGLTQAGDLEQVHVRAWSTVIRVPIETGDLFFKANAPAHRRLRMFLDGRA